MKNKKKYNELEQINIKNQELIKNNKQNENDIEGLMSVNDEKKKIINELRAENKKLKELLKEYDGNGIDRKNKKGDKGTYSEFSIGSEGTGALSGLNLTESEKVKIYKDKYIDYKGRFLAEKQQNEFLKKRIKELEKK